MGDLLGSLFWGVKSGQYCVIGGGSLYNPLGKGPIWPPLIVGVMLSYQFTYLILFLLLVFSHSFPSYVESGLLATE
jgi:hypothetical protein